MLTRTWQRTPTATEFTAEQSTRRGKRFSPCVPTTRSETMPFTRSKRNWIGSISESRANGINRGKQFQHFRLSAFRVCPSAFAQVFRRIVGVTPTEFGAQCSCRLGAHFSGVALHWVNRCLVISDT